MQISPVQGSASRKGYKFHSVIGTYLPTYLPTYLGRYVGTRLQGVQFCDPLMLYLTVLKQDFIQSSVPTLVGM